MNNQTRRHRQTRRHQVLSSRRLQSTPRKPLPQLKRTMTLLVMAKKKHVKLAYSISWCKLDCGASSRFLLLWSWLVPWAQSWSSAATTGTRRVSKREMSGWTKVASKSNSFFFQQLIYTPIYIFHVNTVMKYYSGMNLLESHERILQALFYPIPTTNPSHVVGGVVRLQVK